MSTQQTPEGFWSLEVTENPEPISPMAASVFLPALTAAARHVFAEFGMLADTAEWRSIGGWVYLRSVPLADDPVVAADRIARCVDSVETDLAARCVRRWYEEWRPWVQARAADALATDPAALEMAALDAHLGACVDLLYAATDIHLMLHGSNALMLGELAMTCAELLGWSETQVFALVSGTAQAATGPARALAELADLARILPDPMADPEFAAAFADWLGEFGIRATRYELDAPTLGEQPEVVLAAVRDLVERPYDPAAATMLLERRRTEALAAARAELPADRRVAFETLVDRAEEYYPVREDNEVWTQCVPLGLTRRALREVGARLVGAGALDSVDEVFLLRLDEARAALARTEDLRAVVKERRADRDQALAATPAPFLGDPPPDPDLSALPAPAQLLHTCIAWVLDRVLAPTAAALRQPGPTAAGIGVSPGTARGPVRVVRREADLVNVRPGEVLVARTLSPTWAAFVLSRVAALVLDTGGVISHAAITAREFAVPAVAATGNATALFHDGQVVNVDGAAGSVTPHE